MAKKSFKISDSIIWASGLLGQRNAYIWILSLLQMVNSVASVFYALLMRNIIDAATTQDEKLFFKEVSSIVALALFQIGIGAFMRWMNEYSRSSFENTFKERLFNGILSKDYTCIKKIHTAEWMNRLTGDTVILADGYVDIFPGIIGMVIKLIFALAMIIMMDGRFALIVIPGFITVTVLSYFFRKKLKLLHKEVREKDGVLRIFLQERISSLMAVRGFSAEEQTMAVAEDKMSDHRKARMARNRFSNICRSGFAFGIQGLYLFGLIYCSYRILHKDMSYGTLVAVTQLIAQIQSPFANISAYLPKHFAMSASADRLMEVDQFDNDTNEPILNYSDINRIYHNQLQSISLEDVCFTYLPIDKDDKDDTPVSVKDVNLSINKGEYVAFTGESGCGKSTVLKVMMAFYKPDSGNCLVHMKDNSQDNLTAKYRRLFAYVPQGNMLMNGTIREVISLSASNPDEEKIKESLRIACADEFVMNLEKGLDTIIFENGTGLSEGQMQRLAIARAIYSDHPILLLDEITSALDEETEERVLRNLKDISDKTVVIVTHRKAALSICDRVLHFTKNGIEEG